MRFSLLLSQVWHQISRQTDLPAKQTREICAISLHRPTASSRLHYFDYSESAVHLNAQTTRPHMQERLIHEVRQWGLICCWVLVIFITYVVEILLYVYCSFYCYPCFVWKWTKLGTKKCTIQPWTGKIKGVQRSVYTYEELPLPSQWLWSPRTRYHSAKYTGDQVSLYSIFHMLS